MSKYACLKILHTGVIINWRSLTRTSVYGGDCTMGQSGVSDLYEHQQVQINCTDPVKHDHPLHELWVLTFISNTVTHHNQLFALTQCSKSPKQCKIMVSANQNTWLQCQICSANHAVIKRCMSFVNVFYIIHLEKWIQLSYTSRYSFYFRMEKTTAYDILL